MSLKIPIYSYLAFNNPEGSVSVIKSFGYDVLNVKSRSDVSEVLRQFIVREKEKGLNALAKIHPDRQLILDNPDESKSIGADGTSDIAANVPTATISTAPVSSPAAKSESSYMPLLIGCLIASSMFISAAIIAIKKN
jgi:hypothetical protein